MSEGLRETANEIAASYLQQLQLLGHEISKAINAIAADELLKLQDSVAKQEMLCASLATRANDISSLFAAPENYPPSSIDKEIEARIREATRTIREQSLLYSSLLKRSGRSIAVLSLLYKSHAGQIREECGPGLKRQTWSCEM